MLLNRFMVLAACVGLASLTGLYAKTEPTTPAGGNPGSVTDGKRIYAANCASCHGRSLQGQALWRMVDADTPRRAPAQDGRGSNWLHNDRELLAVVQTGHYPGVAPDPKSTMPAFEHRLSQGDQIAVIAFIKRSWPVSKRISQAKLNPGGSTELGPIPVDWTFPPDCLPHP